MACEACGHPWAEHTADRGCVHVTHSRWDRELLEWWSCLCVTWPPPPEEEA
jgi:hypothetical protein